jgi:hypothetical protein
VPTTDSDTLQFRTVIGNLADKQIENKALQIMKNDPAFSSLRPDQVPEELKRLKQKIAFDRNSPYFEGKDNVERGILKAKLDPYQQTTEKTTLAGGHKYPSKGDGSGNDVDTPEGIFIKTLAGLQQQTPEILEGLTESDEVNENGVPYLDATSLLSGINTGQSREGKPIEPSAVYIDPENPGVILIRQEKGGELTPYTGAGISQLAVSVGNIKGNNLNYKTMINEGKKYGVFGQNNQFTGSNAATADPKFAKQQKTLAKKVATEVVDRKAKLQDAIKRAPGNWLVDFNNKDKEAVENDINSNVLNGASLVVDGKTIKNPKVTIDRGIFGGKTFIISGPDGEPVKLTEEEFMSIAEGKSEKGRLVVGRDAVKSKPKTSTNKKTTGKDPLGILK